MRKNCIMKNIIVFLILSFILNYSCKDDKDERKSGWGIISLSPFITEIIYALGADKDLIAVTDYCTFPEDAKKKTKIGGLLDPNIEKIVMLKPGFIFGQPAHSELNQKLEKFGLKITMMSNEEINDIFNAIKKIGSIINYEHQAEQLIAAIQDSLKIIIEFNKTDYLPGISLLKEINHSKPDAGTIFAEKTGKGEYKDSLTAILVVGREKGSLRNITVAGDNTFIGQMWRLVGGKNLYSDISTRYSIISLESILIRNPDVIIEFDPDGEKQVKKRKITSEWKKFDKVNAIKHGNLYLVSGNHAFIPGPRLYLLAQDFFKIMAGIKNE